VTLTRIKQRSPLQAQRHHAAKTGRVASGVFRPRQLIRSLPDALGKLDPRTQLQNPVMFVVWVGAVLCTVFAIGQPRVFSLGIALWLWLTVLFANLA
jgi:K+-transporting ATPase ATPase B chain